MATKNMKHCNFLSHFCSGKSIETTKARKNQLSSNDHSEVYQM